jgi:hypothetical protein
MLYNRLNDFDPVKKCKLDNMMAVPGTDLCRSHGGSLPKIELKASEAIEAARSILSDSVSKSLMIERIETKIEEFKESLVANQTQRTINGALVWRHDTGAILGLELALQILKDA